MALDVYTTYPWSSQRRKELRELGYKMLHSAHDRRLIEPPYALDSGAWSAHLKKQPFDEESYWEVVQRYGPEADWVVLPDIVAGGLPSLELSRRWLPRVEPLAPVLIAVQDGLSPSDLEPLVGERVGIFVGGGTEWKLQTLPQWGRLKQRTGCWLHVGRVNSAKRINQCRSAGVDSVDGSGLSRWFSPDRARGMEHHDRIQSELKQLHLWGDK